MIASRGRRDQSSNTHSQFFSASQSLRRGNRPHDSDYFSPYNNPESSGSFQSDERSIYNATRVTTPNDCSPRFYASLSHENLVHEQDFAVNMARFVPTGSQENYSSADELIKQGKRQRMGGKLECHTKLLSDQCWQAARRPRPSLSRTESGPGSTYSSHRKAVSLGATDSNGPRMRWPGYLGPAIATAQPRYPPPKRTPTPPGVPSFGTPEAMTLSARFLMPVNNAQSTANLARSGPTDGQRASSYGETIRRFFGLSREPRAGGHFVRGIGRAENGTLVQGRFPYRQSGHGMNLGRQLHDHPFHERNLPVARPEHADIHFENSIENAHAKGDSGIQSRRCFQPAGNPSSGQRLLSSVREFSFPSSPAPVVVNCPRQPRATAISGLSRNLSESNAPSITTTSANQAEPSIPGARATRDHLPPHPSRLHTVFTMAVRSGSTDEDPHTDTPVCLDVLSWVKSQACVCCCLNSHEEPEHQSPTSLGPTSSRETYATAQSQVSPASSQNETTEENSRLHELQSWISSVYGVMFPTFVNPTAR